MTVVGPEVSRPINGQPVAVLSTVPHIPSESPSVPIQHHHRHPVLVDALGVVSDSNGGNTSASNFSSGFETVRPIHVAPVVPRPQPNFQPNLLNNHTEGALISQESADKQSTCTASNSEDSSTATLSCTRGVDRSESDNSAQPQLTSTAAVPAALSFTPAHSSDDVRVKSTRSSPSSGSLILPPPSPWNVDGISVSIGPENIALNSSTVCPPNMFMDAGAKASTDTAEKQACEGFLPPGRKHSDEFDDGHFPDGSARIVQSEPVVLPGQNRVSASGTPQSGAPLALFTEMDTFGSDPFSCSPAMSPDYTKLEDLESESTGAFSSMADENTYAFSTLDSEYLAWMRLSVRDITGTKLNGPSLSALDLDSVDSLRRAQVHHWVDQFNSNPLGLRLNFVSYRFMYHCCNVTVLVVFLSISDSNKARLLEMLSLPARKSSITCELVAW